jgi:hypothetical protein
LSSFGSNGLTFQADHSKPLSSLDLSVSDDQLNFGRRFEFRERSGEVPLPSLEWFTRALKRPADEIPELFESMDQIHRLRVADLGAVDVAMQPLSFQGPGPVGRRGRFSVVRRESSTVFVAARKVCQFSWRDCHGLSPGDRGGGGRSESISSYSDREMLYRYGTLQNPLSTAGAPGPSVGQQQQL